MILRLIKHFFLLKALQKVSIQRAAAAERLEEAEEGCSARGFATDRDVDKILGERKILKALQEEQSYVEEQVRESAKKIGDPS